MKKAIIILCLIASIIPAQDKKDLIIMAAGDSVCLFVTVPPRSTEGYNFYRRGPLPSEQNFILLNTAGPLLPAVDPAKAQEIIGEDWEEVTVAVRSEDSYDALRKLRRDDFSGNLISLMYPRVAQATGRMFIDRGALSGKEYEYKITIVNSSGKVLDSLTKKAVISTLIPDPPADLKAEDLDETLKLTWSYPLWESNLNNLTVKFYVYRKTGSGNFEKVNNRTILRDDQTKPEFIDVWLQNGQEYSYYVTAVDPIGRESKPSKTVQAKPLDKVAPGIPEILNISAEGRKIFLSWKIALESDAAGYNVFRSTSLDKGFTKLNKELLKVGQTAWVDSSILTGIQYFYRVSAVDKNKNESKQSNARNVIAADVVKPDPPSELSYLISNNIVTLKWKNSKTKDLAGYYVYQGNTPETQIRTTSGLVNSPYADNTYAQTGFQPGVIHYAVSAVDSSYNESEKVNVSVLIKDTYPPMPPNNFFVDNFEGRYVTINQGISIAQDIKSYRIYRNEPGQKALVINPEQSVAKVLIDSTVKRGKTYIYYSTAVDTAGNESQPSLTDTLFFRDYSPPASVVNIEIRTVQEGVKLEWEPVIDFDLAGYFVLRSEVPNGIYEKLNNTPLPERQYTDRTGSNKYYYKVVSVDTSGNMSDAEEFVYLP